MKKAVFRLLFSWSGQREFVPALPRLSPRFARCRVGKNSPPDCFFPQPYGCSLLVRFPFTQKKRSRTPLGAQLLFLERTTGIEPAYSAWEADVLPMNYVRKKDIVFLLLKQYSTQGLKKQADFLISGQKHLYEKFFGFSSFNLTLHFCRSVVK